MIQQFNHPSSKVEKLSYTFKGVCGIQVSIKRVNRSKHGRESAFITYWKDPEDKIESVSSRPWTGPTKPAYVISEF